jgi:hypothetical protein
LCSRCGEFIRSPQADGRSSDQDRDRIVIVRAAGRSTGSVEVHHPIHLVPLMKRILTALFALAALGPVHLHAQATAEDSVRAVVTALFDAMRTRDSAAVRASFAPGARLQAAVVRRDGTPALQEDTVDAFARAVGEPGDVRWDEQVDAWHVRIDPPLAVVTVDYTFFAGPRLSHCGIDAFQLFRGPEGWKIFQLTDTRRRTGCRAEIGSSPP